MIVNQTAQPVGEAAHCYEVIQPEMLEVPGGRTAVSRAVVVAEGGWPQGRYSKCG